MFLKETKSILAAATQATFSPTYPEVDFQNLYCTIEYPMERQNYPACWIGFEPMGTIDRGGIDNAFGYAQFDTYDQPNIYSLWRATGYGTWTVGAMTSLQRDRLFDEIVRMFAFNQEIQVVNFRTLIEENPLIAMNLNFDNIAVRGISENPGTPWGTSEIIYEATLAVEAQIEFASDVAGALTPLSQVVVTANDPATGMDFTVTVPQPP
jgi:hypothetical protein